MIKEELYDNLLRKRGIEAQFTDSKTSRLQEDEYQLSAGQRGMWFLQQLRPDSPVYNNPSAVRLNGILDYGALSQAVKLLTEEYETLRTAFRVTDGKVVQFLKRNIDSEIKTIDLIGFEEAAIKTRLTELASLPFDLEKDDLFRVYLLKQSEEQHYLLINIHHIISDGWSKGLLLQTLSQIYRTLIDSGLWQVNRHRAHYRDFVRWQSEWLESDNGKRALKTWQEDLSDRLPILDLVPDKVRKKRSQGAGRMTGFSIDKEVYQKLLVQCRKESLSPFIYLLGVMNVYLYKYTAQPDILIGTPIAGRNQQEFEEVSGFFVNSIVMRNKFEEGMRFLDFVQSVKKNSIRAYQNQDIPFHLLVEKLNPVREFNHSPIFQVMMQFDNTPVQSTYFGSLKLEPVTLDIGVSQVDLSVTFWEKENGLKGTFEWDIELFDQERIDTMVTNFTSLLTRIVNAPEDKISSHQILSNEQYQKIVYEWNNTKMHLSVKNVLDKLSFNARLCGNEQAVVHGRETVTYRELEMVSSRLAGRLSKKGAGNGKYVAICLNRSIEYIIAVYSILKAGAIVVPIDITYPQSYIQEMLEELPDPFMITSQKNAVQLSLNKEKYFILEQLLDAPEQHEFTPVKPDGNSPLCMIFTSGSTGSPKGVLISHRSMENLVESFILSYTVTQKDHIMSISGIASASFIGEILPAISAGAMLVLPEMETILDIETLQDYMLEEKITILSTVPSMIGRLNQSGGLPPCVRLLLSGGESLMRAHINQLHGLKIANGYGLTESGICNTYKLIDVKQFDSTAMDNVGRPVINNKIYVLDKNKMPVPAYVRGEIYISGLSLALGYLNQEQLTNERFIDNPFAEEKMLRTGDIGYFGFNGDLFFCGRMDRQVQLRGFRIELSEIERTLKSYEGIVEAAAVFMNNKPEEYLAVYYTTVQAKLHMEDQVIDWLKRQLPSYMVPKYAVEIEKIPYNHNGKIDYEQLPPIETAAKKHKVLKEQPQNETEKTIALLWKKILNNENIGITDNFFDIGGHSLLLSQVLYELQKIYQIDLKIVDLFEYPTIKQLAAYINQPYQTVSATHVQQRGEKQKTAFLKPLFQKK